MEQLYPWMCCSDQRSSLQSSNYSRRARKIVHNSCTLVQSKSCVDQVCTFPGDIVLNASTLSDFDRSLCITLTSEFSCSKDSETSCILKFISLLDSSSTDSFIDRKFVSDNDIPTSSITPINLQLFNGSLAPSAILETASLNVQFPSGKLLPLTFYVTPLDSSCKAVLGYSFLTCYNPSIDWVSKTISFRNTEQPVSTQTSPPTNHI